MKDLKEDKKIAQSLSRDFESQLTIQALSPDLQDDKSYRIV